jgi:hydrogenase expression/formation protein HypC
MCLAIPGKVLSIHHDGPLPTGKVDFSGVTSTVCFAYTPEVSIGDYVIVHVGFAISIMNQSQAQATLDLLGGKQT